MAHYRYFNVDYDLKIDFSNHAPYIKVQIVNDCETWKLSLLTLIGYDLQYTHDSYMPNNSRYDWSKDYDMFVPYIINDNHETMWHLMISNSLYSALNYVLKHNIWNLVQSPFSKMHYDSMYLSKGVYESLDNKWRSTYSKYFSPSIIQKYTNIFPIEEFVFIQKYPNKYIRNHFNEIPHEAYKVQEIPLDVLLEHYDEFDDLRFIDGTFLYLPEKDIETLQILRNMNI